MIMIEEQGGKQMKKETRFCDVCEKEIESSQKRWELIALTIKWI